MGLWDDPSLRADSLLPVLAEEIAHDACLNFASVYSVHNMKYGPLSFLLIPLLRSSLYYRVLDPLLSPLHCVDVRR